MPSATRIGDDPLVALRAIREALMLPYASISTDGIELAASGTAITETRRLPLTRGEEVVGEVVGLRPCRVSRTPPLRRATPWSPTRLGPMLSCRGSGPTPLPHDHLAVTVRDAGSSDVAWVPGVGLASMRERAAEIDGSVDISSNGEGSLVRALLPLG